MTPGHVTQVYHDRLLLSFFSECNFSFSAKSEKVFKGTKEGHTRGRSLAGGREGAEMQEDVDKTAATQVVLYQCSGEGIPSKFP